MPAQEGLMVRRVQALASLVVLLPLCVPLRAPGQPGGAGPVDAEPEDIRAGLVAVYTSLEDRNVTLTRVDNQPALAWGHGSPHPRLPQGPLEVTWSGLLLVKDAAPLTFEAFVGGEVTVQVDGVTVLKGRGDSERSRIQGQALDRPGGLYRLRIHYRTLAGVAARLQIRWQGPSFGLEPILPWNFKHLVSELPAAAKVEGKTHRGPRGCRSPWLRAAIRGFSWGH